MAEARKGRMALTVRQLVEDYLAHQLTRPTTQISTRHHLATVLAIFFCTLSAPFPALTFPLPAAS